MSQPGPLPLQLVHEIWAPDRDQRFKERALVRTELRGVRRPGKRLVCAFPDGARALKRAFLTAKRFVGVPWYNMHKIFCRFWRERLPLDTDTQSAAEVLVETVVLGQSRTPGTCRSTVFQPDA